jgi:hypothetical protein
MAALEINPRYRERLARQGLAAPEDFLRLPGVILSGHPDRHVRRLTLGSGAESLGVFLKREHCVRWKDRLGSAWAGFGFVSKSRREYRLLRELHDAGVGCPEAVAAGEDGRGRAFVLVRAVEGGRDLRTVLAEAGAAQRRVLAVRLGQELARIHGLGFEHPDLFSKHILVAGSGTLCFLDWQRSRGGGRSRRALAGATWPRWMQLSPTTSLGRGSASRACVPTFAPQGPVDS